jgi:hypothetical protein
VPGLNQRHPVYKTGALPTELTGPSLILTSSDKVRSNRYVTTVQFVFRDTLTLVAGLVPEAIIKIKSGESSFNFADVFGQTIAKVGTE